MTKSAKTPNALSTPATENNPQPPEAKPASWAGLWFLLTLMAAMLSFIFLPQIVRLVGGMGQSVAGEYLGTVQRITYVGGLGQHTQIDTETQTFLLRGAVQINKGIRLELRRGIFDAEVCEVGTQSCRDLISN
jgi:hypothetical protein